MIYLLSGVFARYPMTSTQWDLAMGPQLGPGLASLSHPVGAALVSSRRTAGGDTGPSSLNIQENEKNYPRSGKTFSLSLPPSPKIICYTSPHTTVLPSPPPTAEYYQIITILYMWYFVRLVTAE